MLSYPKYSFIMDLEKICQKAINKYYLEYPYEGSIQQTTMLITQLTKTSMKFIPHIRVLCQAFYVIGMRDEFSIQRGIVFIGKSKAAELIMDLIGIMLTHLETNCDIYEEIPPVDGVDDSIHLTELKGNYRSSQLRKLYMLCCDLAEYKETRIRKEDITKETYDYVLATEYLKHGSLQHLKRLYGKTSGPNF